MTDWATISNFLGRCLLALYFFKAGINNTRHWDKILGLIKAKRIPLPLVALILVIVVQLVGSLALVLNIYALYAAIALIIFTITANIIICNYWAMEGVQKRNVSFLFYANIAVIGALLLIVSMK